jgi:hypothetical protein
MKKTLSILILTLIVGMVSFAQENEKFVISETYTIDNTSAYDLYLRTYDWVLTIYSNPGFELIKDSHENNIIEITGKLPIGATAVQADMKFVLKENQCKMEISNLLDESQAVKDYFSVIQSRMGAVLQSELSPEAKQNIESKL